MDIAVTDIPNGRSWGLTDLLGDPPIEYGRTSAMMREVTSLNDIRGRGPGGHPASLAARTGFGKLACTARRYSPFSITRPRS